MELVGSRCVLTGSVLHLLKGEALAAVADLTLQHVAWAEVRAASRAGALCMRCTTNRRCVGAPPLRWRTCARREGHGRTDCAACGLD